MSWDFAKRFIGVSPFIGSDSRFRQRFVHVATMMSIIRDHRFNIHRDDKASMPRLSTPISAGISSQPK